MTARIQRLRPEHFEAVAALHRRVFRSRTSAHDVARKYATGHTGLENVGWVAFDGTRAIAFHGAIPQRFTLDGRDVLVGQSCDSMAAPEARGSGLYGEAFLATEALLLESGAALMYGFANQDSARALGRLGWQALSLPMNRYTFAAARVPWAHVPARVSPALHATLARRLMRGREVPLDLQGSLAAEGWLAQRFTSESLRYQRRLPSFVVELGAARAWVKASARHLLVGELQVADGDALRASLAQLRRRAARAGLGEVHCFTCPGVRLDGLLSAQCAAAPGMVLMTGTRGGGLLAERLRVTLADADTF